MNVGQQARRASQLSGQAAQQSVTNDSQQAATAQLAGRRNNQPALLLARLPQRAAARQRTVLSGGRLLAGLLGGLVVRAGDVALLGLAHSGLQAFKTMNRQWELGKGSRLRPLWQG